MHTAYMESVSEIDHATALVEQTESLGELVRTGDLSAPVPTCPGWSMNQLFRHVGRGNRWAAQMVSDQMSTALDPREAREGTPPEDVESAIVWLREGAQKVIDAVTEVGADTPIWTFTGPKPSHWWIRRRLHEATVHRADGAFALGVPYELSCELSADGISEWLDLLSALPLDAQPLARGNSIHLQFDDGPTGHWLIHSGSEGVSWEPVDGPATVTVRGSARNLMLALLRRLSSDQAGIEVSGNSEVWQHWLDHTGF
ncbi:maleylpyruvate isomerase family mycothiol-dependent enzyme [Rhodococcus sp. NPDC058521]|uniref:maleylpyruvate isomerase family mycothiol-dependent enzyme n=1 Tax=Rhodococcus sp. NPDC058521 TaxID=3346536 RepID=UPI00365CDD6A